MQDTDLRRVETHLRRTFGVETVSVRARPKIKDSAEVYVGEEFVGTITEDEDEAGSYYFEMAILAEDLDQA